MCIIEEDEKEIVQKQIRETIELILLLKTSKTTIMINVVPINQSRFSPNSVGLTVMGLIGIFLVLVVVDALMARSLIFRF